MCKYELHAMESKRKKFNGETNSTMKNHVRINVYRPLSSKTSPQRKSEQAATTQNHIRTYCNHEE